MQSEARGRVLILAVQGDADERVLRAVEFAGLQHVVASGPEACLAQVAALKPDLILADVAAVRGEPGSFLGAVEKEKRTETLPCLFTGSAEDTAAIPAQVFTPQDFASLFLMIRATLRRERPNVLRGIRRAGPFALEEPSFRLRSSGRSVVLTKRGLCALGPFFDTPGTVIDRGFLARLIFGSGWDRRDDRTVDAYLSRVRRIARAELGVDPIRSVRGRGYTLAV